MTDPASNRYYGYKRGYAGTYSDLNEYKIRPTFVDTSLFASLHDWDVDYLTGGKYDENWHQNFEATVGVGAVDVVVSLSSSFWSADGLIMTYHYGTESLKNKLYKTTNGAYVRWLAYESDDLVIEYKSPTTNSPFFLFKIPHFKILDVD